MGLYDKLHDQYERRVRKGSTEEHKYARQSVRERIFGGEPQPWTIRRVIAWMITGIVACIATGIFLFFASIAVLSIGLPSMDNIHGQAALATAIYDRNGELLYNIFGDENREYIPYEKFSPYIISATVAIEDDQFWQHKGFDFSGLAAAGLHSVTGLGKRRGGSTITQQYVKNAFLSPERSIIRKVRELILSIRLEQKYDKQKILELYLNEIPYGNNAYGIERASELYFGKKAVDLTLAESIILASIPQAPSYFNPYSSHRYSALTRSFTSEEVQKRNIKSAEDIKDDEYSLGLLGKEYSLDDTHKIYLPGRADAVLKRLATLNVITPTEKNEAFRDIQTTQFLPFKFSIKAPHFVFFVRELLEQKYGKEIIEQGGLKVYTTLDYHLQKIAEEAISKRADANQKTYKASNAAAMFADPKTGQILSMVGSRDYFNDDIDGKVNVTIRSRQAGSSFKPIVYAEAFLKGYAPATVLYDTPTQIGPDKPQNYEGTFQGPMAMRRALGQSRNIPAIKTYFLDGEQGPIIELAQKLGITTLDPTHDYGYPLAIGAGEVKMIDMITAFGTFANLGKRPSLTPILKVEDRDGNIIEEFKPDSVNTWEQALDPQVAYLIDNILSDTPIKLSQNLTIPNHTVATKTGTSTNKSKSKGTAYPMDLWVFGYTPSIVGAVWVGNNRGDPLGGNADGSNVSAPIWKEIMTEALKDKEDEPFARPEGIKEVTISTATGLLPNENTPQDKLKSELFASFSVPTEVESAFHKVKVDKRNDLLANEFCPPDMVDDRVFQDFKDPIDNPAWQAGILQWLTGKKENDSSATAPSSPISGVTPTEISPLCIQEDLSRAPTVTILNPASFQEIPDKKELQISIQYKAPSGVKEVTYYFDNLPRLVKNSPPFDSAAIKPPKYVKVGNTYAIRVVVRDQRDYTGEATIQVKIGLDEETAKNFSTPNNLQLFAPQTENSGGPLSPATPLTPTAPLWPLSY